MDIRESTAERDREADQATQRARAERLLELHRQPELLVLVNVWDVASARVVAEQPGCRAVATASAAIAAAHGYADGEQIPRALMLAAVARIAEAVDLPVTADLEAGYDDVAGTIAGALAAGVVGVNLEDRLDPLPESVERIRTARAVADDHGVPLVINARSDAYLLGPAERALDDARRAGEAFLEAGADCVFVPGCNDLDDVARLAEAFGPGRLSLLVQPASPPLAELAAAGAARASFGPYPHRHVLAALAELAAGTLNAG